MEDFEKSYPVLVEIPIAWGDMDAFQHVNNLVYFKHFESARIVYMEKIGFLDFMANQGVGPILASTQCTYKIPLTYPDTVTVGARVDNLDRDRFNMKYAVFSHHFKKIAALGEGLIVVFDYQNSVKTPIPEIIRKNILELEKR